MRGVVINEASGGGGTFLPLRRPLHPQLLQQVVLGEEISRVFDEPLFLTIQVSLDPSCRPNT